MRKLRKRGKIMAYPLIFSIYIAVSCVIIMAFRYLLPVAPPPLPVYVVPWRLTNGLLDICAIFPALLLAGLVMPFGWIIQENEPFPRFSPQFFKRLSPALFTGLAATAVYAVIFFLISPLSQDYYKTMSLKGSLFHQSKAAAEAQAAAGQWLDAEYSITICKRIWRKSAQEGGEIFSLAERISAKATEIRAKNMALETEKIYNIQYKEEPAVFTEWEPVDAQEALASAKTALAENRCFDAYWLANLAMRLLRTKRTSAERRQAERIAEQAWNAINDLAPSEQESETYSLYRQKREGYAAVHDENWLQAYHIFADLITKTPADPDVVNLLAISKRQVENFAFFVDERDVTLGSMSPNPFFSIPINAQNVRAVIKMVDISLFSDSAYGRNVEFLLFDQNHTFMGTITAPFCRLSPQKIDGEERLLVTMRSLNGETNEQFDPAVMWFDKDRKRQELFDDNMQLTLDINYQHFIFLTNLRHGLESLLLNELFVAGGDFGKYGYIEQVFQAEIMYRIFSLIAFLPNTVVVIILGWRLRAKKKPFFIGVPMLFILPVVFQVVMRLYQGLLNTLCIWSVATLGFTLSMVGFTLGTVPLFFLSLLLAAFQRNK
ncbi:MAG: DUF4398 domain-containing protein [Treponema sp.]|nr:DUF4398 domain-containing protein [Treponema sp.]